MFVDVWDAFQEINYHRPVSDGPPSPLPIPDIAAWLQLNGMVETEDCLSYFYFISQLDQEWLLWARKKYKDAHNARTASRNKR